MISADNDTGLYTLEVNEEQLHAIQIGLAEQFMWFARTILEGDLDDETLGQATHMRNLFKETLTYAAHREDVLEFATNYVEGHSGRHEKVINLEEKRKEKNE